MTKNLKGVCRLLVEILCTSALVILIELFWRGIPLWGIPQAEHILQVEISDAALGETRIFTDEEKVRLAHNCLGFLRYRFGPAEESEPQITIRYTGDDGKIYEAAAAAGTVFYGGKAHPLKESDIFINIVEGIFFFDKVAAPQ